MIEAGTLVQSRYEIIKPIGQGGMGAVYLARDQRLGNTVALKETFFNDTLMLTAFEREARLLAGLRHPALPKVMDHFADDTGQFLVMEFIPGDDLQDVIQDSSGSFQPHDVLRWADQILDALDYLHSQDPPIIHRDIKPQNLKLTSRNQIVLLDFGLAKSAGGTTTTTNSGQSIFAYTPSYAPLEQIQGSGTDAQSDIYSLGATLYHLMTGARPVDALSRATAILNGKPDPLTPAHQQNPRVPRVVSDILTQAMALNRDERPATAIVLRKMLGNAAEDGDESRATEAQTVIAQNELQEARPAAQQASATLTNSEAPTLGHPKVSKNTRANRAAQPNRAATSPWPEAARTSLQQDRSNRWGFIAAAVLLLLLGGAFVLYINRDSAPAKIETQPTNTGLIEQKTPQAEQPGTNAVTSTINPSAPAPIPASNPEPVTREESSSRAEADESPKAAEPETTQKPESTDARREPEKTDAAASQPDFRPSEPVREEDRRPPPPDFQRHRGMPPPPPGGMPPPPGRMPERRRP